MYQSASTEPGGNSLVGSNAAPFDAKVCVRAARTGVDGSSAVFGCDLAATVPPPPPVQPASTNAATTPSGAKQALTDRPWPLAITSPSPADSLPASPPSHGGRRAGRNRGQDHLPVRRRQLVGAAHEGGRGSHTPGPGRARSHVRRGGHRPQGPHRQLSGEGVAGRGCPHG